MYTQDNLDYVRGRLSETLVRDSVGEPFYVYDIAGVKGNFRVSGYQVVSPSVNLEVAFDELNLEPVPLGYVNIPKRGAAYLERKPLRNDRSKGLRSRNVRS